MELSYLPLRMGQGVADGGNSADIEFIAPGKEDVVAEFHLDDEALDDIRAATADRGKTFRRFQTE